MAQNPQYNFNGPIDEEEYRRRAEAKAKRRKKRQLQRLALLGGFALAAILLIVAIVMFFRSIFGKDNDKKKTSSSLPPSSISVVESVPQYGYPVAPDTSLWSLQLVNVQHPLPDGYAVPDDQLANVVEDGVAYWFDARIVDSLKQMIADCNSNVEGGSLRVVSGYRSATNQNGRYSHLIEVLKGQGYTDTEADVVARQSEPPAGLSEHQLGLAVDFVTGTVSEPSGEFAGTPEYQWLIGSAANYGFILRYPSEKEAITGMTVQPYHFRYVGVEEAKVIAGAGICLEEYMMALPEAQPAESVPDPVVSSAPTDPGGQAGSVPAG